MDPGVILLAIIAAPVLFILARAIKRGGGAQQGGGQAGGLPPGYRPGQPIQQDGKTYLPNPGPGMGYVIGPDGKPKIVRNG